MKERYYQKFYIVFEEHNNGTNYLRLIIKTIPEHSLKFLAKLYAKIRCVSIKSLQFSYKGKMMFLGNVKNKTPNQLGMQDYSVITVRHKLIY